MLSCVEAILRELHQSAPHLLADELLDTAATTARGARISANAQEVSEAAQRLEEVVEEIRGKQLDPASSKCHSQHTGALLGDYLLLAAIRSEHRSAHSVSRLPV